jgi:hypothetical protein
MITICPNCDRPTSGGLFGHMNDPKNWWEQKWVVTHCGCYHEPKGGERYTAERDHVSDSVQEYPSTFPSPCSSTNTSPSI